MDSIHAIEYQPARALVYLIMYGGPTLGSYSRGFLTLISVSKINDEYVYE